MGCESLFFRVFLGIATMLHPLICGCRNCWNGQYEDEMPAGCLNSVLWSKRIKSLMAHINLRLICELKILNQGRKEFDALSAHQPRRQPTGSYAGSSRGNLCLKNQQRLANPSISGRHRKSFARYNSALFNVQSKFPCEPGLPTC